MSRLNEFAANYRIEVITQHYSFLRDINCELIFVHNKQNFRLQSENAFVEYNKSKKWISIENNDFPRNVLVILKVHDENRRRCFKVFKFLMSVFLVAFTHLHFKLFCRWITSRWFEHTSHCIHLQKNRIPPPMNSRVEFNQICYNHPDCTQCGYGPLVIANVHMECGMGE